MITITWKFDNKGNLHTIYIYDKVKQKSTKQKKRHMYMFTLSQKTIETPLLGFTKFIAHLTLPSYLGALQVPHRDEARRSPVWRFSAGWRHRFETAASDFPRVCGAGARLGRSWIRHISRHAPNCPNVQLIRSAADKDSAKSTLNGMFSATKSVIITAMYVTGLNV